MHLHFHSVTPTPCGSVVLWWCGWWGEGGPGAEQGCSWQRRAQSWSSPGPPEEPHDRCISISEAITKENMQNKVDVSPWQHTPASPANENPLHQRSEGIALALEWSCTVCMTSGTSLPALSLNLLTHNRNFFSLQVVLSGSFQLS